MRTGPKFLTLRISIVPYANDYMWCILESWISVELFTFYHSGTVTKYLEDHLVKIREKGALIDPILKLV